MLEPSDRAPEPVLLLVAVLYREEDVWRAAREALEAAWGPVDVEGPPRSFDATSYYAAEMGADLQRRLVSLRDLVSPGSLVAAKRLAVEIEQRLACSDPEGAASRRRVNLDIGYLDHGKVVLASLKSAGQKIWLGDGVWADLVLRFSRGRYRPLEWTFPDLRDGRYDEELAAMRRRYLDAR